MFQLVLHKPTYISTNSDHDKLGSPLNVVRALRGKQNLFSIFCSNVKYIFYQERDKCDTVTNWLHFWWKSNTRHQSTFAVHFQVHHTGYAATKCQHSNEWYANSKRWYVNIWCYSYLCLSACLSVRRSVCLSVCMYVHPSIHPSIYLSVCLSVCLSACLSICPSFYLSSLNVSQRLYLSRRKWERMVHLLVLVDSEFKGLQVKTLGTSEKNMQIHDLLSLNRQDPRYTQTQNQQKLF